MSLTDADMTQLLAMLNRINIRMQQRRKLAADWIASNEVLRVGEIGLETDTWLEKHGDGATPWNDLPYVAAGPIDLSAKPTDKQVLVWDAAAARWIPKDQSGGSGGGPIDTSKGVVVSLLPLQKSFGDVVGTRWSATVAGWSWASGGGLALTSGSLSASGAAFDPALQPFTFEAYIRVASVTTLSGSNQYIFSTRENAKGTGFAFNSSGLALFCWNPSGTYAQLPVSAPPPIGSRVYAAFTIDGANASYYDSTTDTVVSGVFSNGGPSTTSLVTGYIGTNGTNSSVAPPNFTVEWVRITSGYCRDISHPPSLPLSLQ